MALCQLALSVATGKSWLGTFTVPTPGRVLLALGEEDAEEVRRRLYNAGRAMGLSSNERRLALERIIMLPLAGVPCSVVENGDNGNQNETDFFAWLQGKLSESGEPWRLLIFDPLSRFAGPEAEKDNAAATRFVQAIEALTNMPDKPTAIVAHHTNKGARKAGQDVDTSSARGSSALTDGARWVATIAIDRLTFEDHDVARRLAEVVTIEVTKNNYASFKSGIELRRDSENNGALIAIDETDKATVKTAREKAISQSQLAEKRANTAARNADTRAAEIDMQRKKLGLD